MTLIPLGAGGEFDRIREIAEALGPAAGLLGGDTAPIPPGEGTLVVSTDASIEHEHFHRAWLTSKEIGWRSTASALSDLAAAGASAAGIVVALGVPEDAQPGDAVNVMRGVGDCVLAANAKVLGGDLSRAAGWTVVVTVFGYALRPMSRVGARPGDQVWVTGTLGGARAAVFDWFNDRKPEPAARLAFVHPVPRLSTGQWLAAHGATAMMDLSDGLAGDTLHLAAASRVHLAIDLDRLPLHSCVVAAARKASEVPGGFAGVGGEDFELLVTLPAGWDDAARCEADTGVALTRIGEVMAGTGVTTTFGGVAVHLDGFRHTL